jgi:predicted nucleic acid-binding protein
MSKLYIDTNVIIDAVEGRKNKFGKNIGDYASDLFNDAIICKHQLVISSFTLYELYKKGINTTIFFEMIKKKRIHLDHDESDEDKARKLKEDNFDDALHVILAEKAQADVIITRNIEDFKEISTNIPVRRPEQLL